MLTSIQSAGVAPEVNLRNSLHAGDKAHKQGIHPSFETQGRRHQKSKTGVSVAPLKGLTSSKNLEEQKETLPSPILRAVTITRIGEIMFQSTIERIAMWKVIEVLLYPSSPPNAKWSFSVRTSDLQSSTLPPPPKLKSGHFQSGVQICKVLLYPRGDLKVYHLLPSYLSLNIDMTA